MDFIYEDSRIYALAADGKITAEVTFPEKDGVANINHTFVDSSLRGQGIAGKLVRAAADQITACGHQIKATCPYAIAWFQKHPEYSVIDSGDELVCRINAGDADSVAHKA